MLIDSKYFSGVSAMCSAWAGNMRSFAPCQGPEPDVSHFGKGGPRLLDAPEEGGEDAYFQHVFRARGAHALQTVLEEICESGVLELEEIMANELDHFANIVRDIEEVGDELHKASLPQQIW